MWRSLLAIPIAVAACTPAPREAAVPRPADSSRTVAASPGPPGPGSTPASASGEAVTSQPPESATAAAGRRVLSTAFVRVGPDQYLTVELRDGRVLILRDVVLRAQDFCGAQVMGDQTSTKFCGGYAEVAAARPGGAPATEPPGAADPSRVEPAPNQAKGT